MASVRGSFVLWVLSNIDDGLLESKRDDESISIHPMANNDDVEVCVAREVIT